MAEQLAFKNLDRDANGIFQTGFWTIADPNSQYNARTQYGVLISLVVGGSYPYIQIVFNRGDGRLFYRTSNANREWGEWYTLL